MNQIKILYNMKKMYTRLLMTLIVFIGLGAIFTVLDRNLHGNLPILLFIVICIAVFIYGVWKFKKIKALDYFIMMDNKGIYTQESFVFCSWSNIKNIDLRRYMGYQTLFFEVKSANLDTKIKPVHKNGKIYYCLPLPDCDGKPSAILSQVKRARKKSKKD